MRFGAAALRVRQECPSCTVPAQVHRIVWVQMERILESVWLLERQSGDALVLALETFRRWLRTA